MFLRKHGGVSNFREKSNTDLNAYFVVQGGKRIVSTEAALSDGGALANHAKPRTEQPMLV